MKPTQPSLLALAHRISQFGNARLQCKVDGHDLTARQAQVLAAIAEHDGASQTALVYATGVDRSTMAELIRRLEHQGLVKRKRSNADARAYVVGLTSKGVKAASAGAKELSAIEADLLSALPVTKQKEVLSLMSRLAESNGA